MITLLILPIIGGLVSLFLHWKFKNRNTLRMSERWIQEHKYLYEEKNG